MATKEEWNAELSSLERAIDARMKSFNSLLAAAKESVIWLESVNTEYGRQGVLQKLKGAIRQAESQ